MFVSCLNWCKPLGPPYQAWKIHKKSIRKEALEEIMVASERWIKTIHRRHCSVSHRYYFVTAVAMALRKIHARQTTAVWAVQRSSQIISATPSAPTPHFLGPQKTSRRGAPMTRQIHSGKKNTAVGITALDTYFLACPEPWFTPKLSYSTLFYEGPKWSTF